MSLSGATKDLYPEEVLEAEATGSDGEDVDPKGPEFDEEDLGYSEEKQEHPEPSDEEPEAPEYEDVGYSEDDGYAEGEQTDEEPQAPEVNEEDLGYSEPGSDEDSPQVQGEIGTFQTGTMDTTMAGNEHESADSVTGTFSDADAQQQERIGSEQEAAADQAGDYNPDEHTVTEVKQYFATADDEEVDRVKAAEAQGQNRVGIVNYQR
jgi:hypothetical protein